MIVFLIEFSVMQSMLWVSCKSIKPLLLSVFLVALVITLCRFPIVLNVSHSLPQKIFVVDAGDLSLRTNDFVVFKASNLPNMPNGYKVIKKVMGVFGDKFKVQDNVLYKNGQQISKIYYTKAYWGKIQPIASITVPKDCFFMMGTAKTSFDSRYKDFGIVCKNLIIGRAYPYF